MPNRKNRRAKKVNAPKVVKPDENVLNMFRLIREILNVALMPGGDAEAIVSAQRFIDHLLNENGEENVPRTKQEEPVGETSGSESTASPQTGSFGTSASS